jgi:hypothetical protein
MKADLLIIADRAQMKTFRLAPSPAGRSASLQLLDTFKIDEARGRYADEFTDNLGAFPNGGTNGQGNSSTERMDLAAENEMRSFRKLATRIEEIVRAEHPQRWAFAAPSEINGAILDGLATECRSTLAQNLRKDLVNLPTAELLEHFEKA